MKKILLAVMSAVLLSTSPLQAAYDQQVFMRGVRPMGMGGAFVALSDDQNAIFYNPAGLTQRQGSQFTLIELPLNISDDVLQFYNFYNDNKDSLKDFDNLSDDRKIDLLNQINDNVIKYRPNLRLGLPNTSFLSGAGFISWGFGIFNQEDIGFKFNRSLIVPSISFWGNADAVAAVPLAHRFDALPFVPGKLSVGTTLKYIARAKIEELNKSVLEFEDFAPQLQYGKGFGFDLGTIYQPSDRWNVGMQVTDVGGTKMTYEAIETSEKGKVNKPSYNSVIKPQWNVGTVYTPSKIYFWPGHYINTQDRLQFAVDVRDIANSDEQLLDATFFKKLHMGGELRWGPASLRAGLSSGYPSFGVGMRIPYLGLRADYAFWGEELGRYAGQIPSWNHQVTLALSWGDSSGKAYGKAAANKSSKVAKKVSSAAAQEVKRTAAAVASTAAASVPAVISTGTVSAQAVEVGTTTANAVEAAAASAAKEVKTIMPAAQPTPAQTAPAAPAVQEKAVTAPAAAAPAAEVSNEKKASETATKGTTK